MHMINGFCREIFCSLMIGCYVGFTTRKERWRSIIRRMRKRGWWWWLLILLRRRIRNARVTWFHRTSRVPPRFRASRNGLILRTRLMRPCLVPCCKMTLLSLSFRIRLISPLCSRTRWSRNRSSTVVLVLRGKIVKGMEFEAFSEYPAKAPEGELGVGSWPGNQAGLNKLLRLSTLWVIQHLMKGQMKCPLSTHQQDWRMFLCFVLFIIKETEQEFQKKKKKKNCKRNSDHFKSQCIHIYVVYNTLFSSSCLISL